MKENNQQGLFYHDQWEEKEKQSRIFERNTKNKESKEWFLDLLFLNVLFHVAWGGFDPAPNLPVLGLFFLSFSIPEQPRETPQRVERKEEKEERKER